MDVDSDARTMRKHMARGMELMESGAGTGGWSGGWQACLWFGIAVAFLASGLVSFHLRCEIAAHRSMSHGVLVFVRETVLASMLVLFGLACAWSRHRWVRYLPLAVAGAGGIALWGYRVYVLCRSDYPRLPGELLASGEGVSFLGRAIEGVVSWWDLLFLLPILAVAAGRRIPRGFSPWGWKPWTSLAGAYLGILVIVGFRTGDAPWEQDRSGCFRQYGLPWLVVADSVALLARRKDGSGADLRVVPTPVSVDPPPVWRPRRILLIQTESLDRTAMGDPRLSSAVMPYLSSIIREGRMGPFQVDAKPLVAIHGVGASADCEFAVWFGRPPNPVLPWWKIIDQQGGAASLSHRFVEAGIDVRSFHGNPGTFFSRRKNHVDHMGFSSHSDRDDLGLRPQRWGSDDREFLGALVGRLRLLAGERWVVHAITFSTHSPFDWVEDYPAEGMPQADMDSLRRDYPGRTGRYLASMRYLDAAFARYLPELIGFSDLTLLYGDHPSGLWGPGYSDGSDEVDGVRRELTMLIRFARAPLSPLPELPSHFDVHATLADAFLDDGASYASCGRSLLRAPAGSVAVADE